VLQQYAPASDTEVPSLPTSPVGAATRLAFPTIVTPYGIAAVINILAVSPSALYVLGGAAALVAVMLLKLLATLYAQKILSLAGTMPLQIVGTVLSVLQVARGVQMIRRVAHDWDPTVTGGH
jgi:multiple antibiotic resistance protein